MMYWDRSFKFFYKIFAGLQKTATALLLCLLYSSLLYSFPSLSNPINADLEYQVKAAFLYNFIKFVEWPASSLSLPEHKFNLCIYGNDPFGNKLEALRNRMAKGHHIELVYLNINQSEFSNCHLLFIAHASTSDGLRLLPKLAEKPILTVGEEPSFVRNGGMLSFTLGDGGHVGIEINLQPVQRARLMMSAKLLEVATIVVGHDADATKYIDKTKPNDVTKSVDKTMHNDVTNSVGVTDHIEETKGMKK